MWYDNLYIASEKLYHYIWKEIADIIIKESKPRLSGSDEKDKHSAQWTLRTLIEDSLKLLHPFMPFVTKEIWGALPNKEGSLLLIQSWPKTS